MTSGGPHLLTSDWPWATLMKDSHPSFGVGGWWTTRFRASIAPLSSFPARQKRAPTARWPLQYYEVALVRIISGQAPWAYKYLPRPQPPPLQRHNSGGLIRTPPPFRGWSPPHTHSGSATQAGACKLMGKGALSSVRTGPSSYGPGSGRVLHGGGSVAKGGLPIWEIAESRSTIAGARP